MYSNWGHNQTVVYPNPWYNMACYTEDPLYLYSSSVSFIADYNQKCGTIILCLMQLQQTHHNFCTYNHILVAVIENTEM